jgi:hypothetical protein
MIMASMWYFSLLSMSGASVSATFLLQRALLLSFRQRRELPAPLAAVVTSLHPLTALFSATCAFWHFLHTDYPD